jgi:hypothetical protein
LVKVYAVSQLTSLKYYPFVVKVYAESQSTENAELTELVGLINKLRGAAGPPAPAYTGGRRLLLKEGRHNPTYLNQVRH